MKKTYTKPEISFESFLMSTNIAGDCELKADTQSNYNTCGLVFGDKILFGTNLTGCTKYGDHSLLFKPYEKKEGYESFCYHTPTTGTNIFNS